MRAPTSKANSHNRDRVLAVRNTSQQNKPRVLVVDDDPASAQAMLQVLSNLGMNVTIVFQGLDAVEMLRNEQFDLFVLDWRMPNFDGSDVIRSLYNVACGKNEEHIRITRTPLIIYSGLSEDDLKPPEELGIFEVSGFLQKPSSISELACLVMNTLNRA